MEQIVSLLAKFIAVIFVLSLHEFAHAFVAYQCGDPTAKWAGRMTLNPMAHFDPVGIVMFALVGFGWAKPVPVNPDNFKNRTRGSFLTSGAGVAVNYLSAFLLYPLFLLALQFYFNALPQATFGHLFLYWLTYYLFAYSMSFCVFNLLPLYPLDGFRLVDSLNKTRGKAYCFLRDYGEKILTGLIVLSFAADLLSAYLPAFAYLDILGYVMRFATNIFGKPITAFWNLIFY